MIFRKATREDVAAIASMLADDEIGALREVYSDPLPELYYRAYDKIAGKRSAYRAADNG